MNNRLIVCLGLFVFGAGCAALLAGELRDDARSALSGNEGVPWPAMDGLGRRLPTGAEVPSPRKDRTVGLFYFLWHEGGAAKVYDVARILAADPDAKTKPGSPLWGGYGVSHYWGEPLFGYYRSDDPWVLRRHAQLLADAGVDVLIFDTTNAVIYRDIYRKLCDVFAAVRREGGRTPQICFMVNTEAGKTAQQIYDDLYKPGLYPELWFRWQGKPLMICDPQAATPEVSGFFTLRRAHWPFEMINTPNAWHWEATYPQPYGYTDDPKKPEQVNVSVAQNLRASDGKVTDMSNGDARGRSFHDGKMDLTTNSVNAGYNFQEQWKRAFELDPPFVMVTGWNEWIAGRWDRNGPLKFVDQFDEQYSRDIEPMKGGHGDHYYYQLVANIRRYKGVPPLPTASAPKTIKISAGFDQWKDVGPEFSDYTGDSDSRDSIGAGAVRYTTPTGRNDLVTMKVAVDRKKVYFYVRTRGPTVPASDAAGIWLLIDADQDGRTGWAGYDYIVNRESGWLEKNAGGWRWEKVAKLERRVEGNEMHLAFPRAALGSNLTAFDFKWVDNLQEPFDVTGLYQCGDAAPEGRFNYRYGTNGFP